MSSTAASQSRNGHPDSTGGGLYGKCAASNPPSSSMVIPCKRSDDDVQFISSNPVKRRKISKAHCEPLPPLVPRSTSESQLQSHPQLPSELLFQPVDDHRIHLADVPYHNSNIQMDKTSDVSQGRRVSTGMVGLPSDIYDIESIYAMRGVSLPVLENFVFNQPSRKSKPIGSPALSPKQLPEIISSTLLKINPTQVENNESGLRREIGPPSCLPGNVVTNKQTAALGPSAPAALQYFAVLNSPLAPTSSPSPPQMMSANSPSILPPPDQPSELHQNSTSYANIGPQPPCQPILQQTSLPASAARLPRSKLHCHICAQMAAQRAAPTRAHIPPAPMTSPKIPIHNQPMTPPIACISTYNAHSLPPFMPMSPSNVQAFPRGNGATMMTMQIPDYGSMIQQTAMPPARQQAPVQLTSSVPTLPKTPPSPAEMSPASTVTFIPLPTAPSSPFKPPATLIQPTYRKPSPNLIVDVAETCQEKFPFEEVAKRHGTTIEKVTDVFAAIIQVPLLRCPTDRRRPGRLATTRVKEFTKAKKDIQEERANGVTKGKIDAVVIRPLDIAERLGPVDVLEEFGRSG